LNNLIFIEIRRSEENLEDDEDSNGVKKCREVEEVDEDPRPQDVRQQLENAIPGRH